MTFHFFETNAKAVANPVLHPMAKIPEYKGCTVGAPMHLIRGN